MIDICLISALDENPGRESKDAVPVKLRRSADSKRRSKISRSSPPSRKGKETSKSEHCTLRQMPEASSRRRGSETGRIGSETGRASSRIRDHAHQTNKDRRAPSDLKTHRSKSRQNLLQKSASSKSLLCGQNTLDRALVQSLQKSRSVRNFEKSSTKDETFSTIIKQMKSEKNSRNELSDRSRPGRVRAASRRTVRDDNNDVNSAQLSSGQYTRSTRTKSHCNSDVPLTEFFQCIKEKGRGCEATAANLPLDKLDSTHDAPRVNDTTITCKIRGILRSLSHERLLYGNEVEEEHQHIHGVAAKNLLKKLLPDLPKAFLPGSSSSTSIDYSSDGDALLNDLNQDFASFSEALIPSEADEPPMRTRRRTLARTNSCRHSEASGKGDRRGRSSRNLVNRMSNSSGETQPAGLGRSSRSGAHTLPEDRRVSNRKSASERRLRCHSIILPAENESRKDNVRRELIRRHSQLSTVSTSHSHIRRNLLRRRQRSSSDVVFDLDHSIILLAENKSRKDNMRRELIRRHSQLSTVSTCHSRSCRNLLLRRQRSSSDVVFDLDHSIILLAENKSRKDNMRRELIRRHSQLSTVSTCHSRSCRNLLRRRQRSSSDVVFDLDHSIVLLGSKFSIWKFSASVKGLYHCVHESLSSCAPICTKTQNNSFDLNFTRYC
jgi:hypothetical protein